MVLPFKSPCSQKEPLSLPPPDTGQEPDPTEKIINCAIWLNGGVFTHDKAFNHFKMEMELKEQGVTEGIPFYCRGFFTDKGRFIGQYEAMQLALANGQKRRSHGVHYRYLYADDLWPRDGNWNWEK